MPLTFFLAAVFCGAITLMPLFAVAFVHVNILFSSVPKEAREVILFHEKELYYSAKAMGKMLMTISLPIGADVGRYAEGLRGNPFTDKGYRIRDDHSFNT